MAPSTTPVPGPDAIRRMLAERYATALSRFDMDELNMLSGNRVTGIRAFRDTEPLFPLFGLPARIDPDSSAKRLKDPV